jgi:twitching motility protein PilT
LRDLETIQLALTAAETGHLVFGTLHTNSAPSTINRIIDVFPPAQQEQVRAQLAGTLRAVVTQRLFRRVDMSGRIAAFEVMICNTAIRNLIRENKIFQIPNVMQTARQEGMLLMENSIRTLIAERKIAVDSTLTI